MTIMIAAGIAISTLIAVLATRWLGRQNRRELDAHGKQIIDAVAGVTATLTAHEAAAELLAKQNSELHSRLVNQVLAIERVDMTATRESFDELRREIVQVSQKLKEELTALHSSLAGLDFSGLQSGVAAMRMEQGRLTAQMQTAMADASSGISERFSAATAALPRILAATDSSAAVLAKLDSIESGIMEHVKHIEIMQEAHADQIAHEMSNGAEDPITRAEAVYQRIQRACHIAGVKPPNGIEKRVKANVLTWAPIDPAAPEPQQAPLVAGESRQ